MSTVINLLIITSVGSVLSLTGSFILSFKKWSDSLTSRLISFAAGVLLSTAILDLLPEALSKSSYARMSFVFLLVGVTISFFLEKSILTYHHHNHKEHGLKPSVYIMMLGDSIHNFLDGVAISTAYLTNPYLGISTAIAVASHEIPQEISDFTIAMESGLSRKKALLINLYSSFAAVLGAVATLVMYRFVMTYSSYVFAFAAGNFLYIACADIIPELHKNKEKESQLVQSLLFIVGIAVSFTFKYLVEGF